MERKPGERVEAGAATNTMIAIDEAEMLDLLYGRGDVMVANAELHELIPRREQVAVFLAALPHMLDHQEVEQPARIDAERTPRLAFEQIAGKFDELLAIHGRHPLLSTS